MDGLDAAAGERDEPVVDATGRRVMDEDVEEGDAGADVGEEDAVDDRGLEGRGMRRARRYSPSVSLNIREAAKASQSAAAISTQSGARRRAAASASRATRRCGAAASFLASAGRADGGGVVELAQEVVRDRQVLVREHEVAGAGERLVVVAVVVEEQHLRGRGADGLRVRFGVGHRLGGVAVLVHGIKVFGGVTSCVGILIKRTKHELANNKNRD